MNYLERLSVLREERTDLKKCLVELKTKPGEEAELQSDLIAEDLGRINMKIFLLPLRRAGELIGVIKAR